MRKIMVIVSAKLINGELQQMFGKIPPVLLPYKNQTALKQICEENSENYEIIVIGGELKELIEKEIIAHKLPCKLVEATNSSTLAESVLTFNFSMYEELLVVLGDTLIEGMDFKKYNKDMIAYQNVENNYEYTAFEQNEENHIVLVNSSGNLQKVFCGIYSFSNPQKLYKSLENTRNFYDSITEYSKHFSFEIYLEDQWIDLGHYRQFQNSEIKEVESRYFNEIIIDRECGTLTKKSIEKEKFINEINWYLQLPRELEYLSPRIFDYSTSYNEPFVTMEYYGYLTLHHMYMHGNFPTEKWGEIFDVLIKTREKFNKYEFKLDIDRINSSLIKLYHDKTVDRLRALADDEQFSCYFQEFVNINGKQYHGLYTIMKTLFDNIEKYLLNLEQLSIIHGDYFFANILYDSKSNFVRLVDPRGDFGGHGIYGDPRYDIAKLSHSVHGKYDYIVSDKFSINIEEDKVEYNILENSNTEIIEELFFKKINSIANVNEIKFIESLLFLSMVPLHKDYPARQHVMLMTGITQYNEFM